MKYNREEFEEVIVKVVKGGRKFRFTALVVVGNRKGLVGYGFGKSKEVPDAIKKAVDDAFKNIIDVKLNGSTIAPNAATNPSMIPSKICAPASIISWESPTALKFSIISSKKPFVSSQLKQFFNTSDNVIFLILSAIVWILTLIGIEIVVSPS